MLLYGRWKKEVTLQPTDSQLCMSECAAKKCYRREPKMYMLFLWRISFRVTNCMAHNTQSTNYLKTRCEHGHGHKHTHTHGCVRSHGECISLYGIDSVLWNAKLPIIWCANKYDIHRCSLICALRLKQWDLLNTKKKTAAARAATAAVAEPEPEPHFISIFLSTAWIVLSSSSLHHCYFGGSFDISWERE